ncbi:MAG: hypothetical protein JXB62_10045 [Pirellulales bacterium]|nr:hypothetical protein [Pirellulales bacterium]
MKQLQSVFVAAALAVLCGGSVVLSGRAAAAQDYRFGVPKLQMLVSVRPDASVHIAYDITFRNHPGAHAIDVVDIGTPHKGYDLGNIQASSGGRPLGGAAHSTYIDCGFEIPMGAGTIQPGREGTLHVEFDMPEMVFQDTTNAELASLRITPTWFDGSSLQGNTHIQVAVQLPRSVKPEEALHQGLKFTSKAATDDGALVGWDWPADRLDGPHLVAVSFPKRGLDRVVVLSKLDLLLKWFRESKGARVTVAIVFLVAFGLLFFRFTGGTGISVWVVLSAVACFVFYLSPGLHLLSMPTVFVLIGFNEWSLARRKVHYMPPVAQVEGGGIKRGLTAPEAAALLELPVAKVLGLVVFGMLKKGMLRQQQADPLIVEVDQDFLIPTETPSATVADRYRFYRNVGQKKGTVVHKYEHGFLYLIQHNPGKPLQQINFSVPLRKLIERAAARMKGFDLSDTQDYYRSIVRRACDQASAVGDLAQREKAIDRNFEWILMGEDHGRVFDYGRPYRPIWIRGLGAPSSGGVPAGGGAPSIPGQTSFGDVAASFSGWAENTMGSMATSISPGSLNVARPAGGFLNLSGADKVTGEFFQALGEAAASGGGGGGGGGGCACACAGCACACACAGGGR